MWTAEALITNAQGGRLDALCCQPGQHPHVRLLSAVVVHTALTMFSKSPLDILQPFTKMLNSPGDLEVGKETSECHSDASFLLPQRAYLPTMPQDLLPEARRVLGGAFYGRLVHLTDSS